jgi:hypothetical protein
MVGMSRAVTISVSTKVVDPSEFVIRKALLI